MGITYKMEKILQKISNILPCELRQLVYGFPRRDYKIEEGKIKSIDISYDPVTPCGYMRIIVKFEYGEEQFIPRDFNKIIFFTKEEAEQALKGGNEK